MARPVGTTNGFQLRDFFSYAEIVKFVNWVKKNYKTNPAMASKVVDKLFSNPPQEVNGSVATLVTFRFIEKSPDRFTETLPSSSRHLLESVSVPGARGWQASGKDNSSALKVPERSM